MVKQEYRGSKYRVDAPGFDAQEWAVVKINIPVPWTYIDNPELSPEAVAEMFSGELTIGVKDAFEATIEALRRGSAEDRRGQPLFRPVFDTEYTE